VVGVEAEEVDFVGIDFDVNFGVDLVVAIDLDAEVGVETDVDDGTVASLLLLLILDFLVLRGFI
jgi:hypothetical protein